MNIEIKALLPFPVAELPHDDSEVWQAESVVFESGKTYLLTATSGKGKTTLLSVIYGIRKDYSGEACFDNTNIRTFGDRQWPLIRKKQLSYIFQGLELFDDLSAMENIMVKNRQTNYYSETTLKEIAAEFHIGPYLNRRVAILSYGQKQRVAIIRALCQPFSFLLADEIFSHLDEGISRHIFSFIGEECRKRNAGLLFTALQKPAGLEFDHTYRI